MDYKALAERIKCPNIQKCPFEKNEMSCKQCQYKICDEAATAITDLLARAEAAEARCETVEKMVKEYQDTIVPGYRERAEKEGREAKEAQREVTFCQNGWKKAERERDGFKAKYIEAVNRACELSKIVDDHGWEE